MAEQRICALSGERFLINDDDLAFYHNVAPVINGARFLPSLPTLSPLERQRRRLSFRNLRNLYHRTCDKTGRKIISMYAPDNPHVVYHSEDWWSDSWDAISYGRPFDFNRPFFEQFKELMFVVPQIHTYVVLSENCDYINGAANCKDCYLAFNMDYCQQCYYVTNASNSLTCIDCLNVSRCEVCYECVDCQNCFGLAYSERCIGCYDSYFLTDCRQCHNCIGCSNLVNKTNYLFNKPVSAEDIAAFKTRFRSRLGRNEFTAASRTHSLSYPRKHFFGHSNESFSGNNIHHIKNSYHCFEAFELENCKYCNYVFQANNCMDFNIFGDHSQWIYECLATGINASNNLFCAGCWSGASNNMYSHTVTASSNCFGCAGLQRKQYCVLNMQYSKSDYDTLVERIINHMRRTNEWGEFFPSSLSPFSYNESVAHEYFPLTKDEALTRGLKWRDVGERNTVSPDSILPDTIGAVADTITKQVLQCRVCRKNYKIIGKELDHYRSWEVPPPDACPECRHGMRLKRTNPYYLWERSCDRCGTALESAFEPSRSEIVYCEQCYLNSLSQ